MTSTIDKELLNLLCCPKCKGDLRLEAERSALVCERCSSVYRVKDGIPMMLPET